MGIPFASLRAGLPMILTRARRPCHGLRHPSSVGILPMSIHPCGMATPPICNCGMGILPVCNCGMGILPMCF